MSAFTVTCGHCSHHGELAVFTATPLRGDLPPGQFQCPSCKRAWRIVHGRIYTAKDRRGKFIVSEPNKIIPAEALP